MDSTNNSRVITIQPNKSISFNVSIYDHNTLISDEYWRNYDDIFDRYDNGSGVITNENIYKFI